MEEKKFIFAGNLIRLRTDLHMTQAELGERIHYSDKSISKWERAEALPDEAVIARIAEVLGTTPEDMLTSRDAWSGEVHRSRVSTPTIAAVTLLGIWTVAVLLFVIFWIRGVLYWLFLIAAVPASLCALLVLNILWFDRRINKYIVGAMVASLFFMFYYIFRRETPWQIFLLFPFAEAIVFLSYHIRRKSKKP